MNTEATQHVYMQQPRKETSDRRAHGSSCLTTWGEMEIMLYYATYAGDGSAWAAHPFCQVAQQVHILVLTTVANALE